MAAERYLTLGGPQGTSTILRSLAQVSTGAPDGGRGVALADNGLLDPSFLPNGVGETVLAFTASEAIGAGRLVNVKSDGTIQLADQSSSRTADGFAPVAIANGATGNVYFSGIVSGLSGLTPASKMFLGAAGALTATPGTTLWQPVGKALSATQVEFVRGEPIIVT